MKWGWRTVPKEDLTVRLCRGSATIGDASNRAISVNVIYEVVNAVQRNLIYP
jgi:hypothetical protein